MIKESKIEESLRIMILSGRIENNPIVQENIFNTEPKTLMSNLQKELFFEKLGIKKTLSFGVLLKKQLDCVDISVENLSEVCKISTATIQNLFDDSIPPNKIPILSLKSILNKLNLTFQGIENSIEETFRLLKNQSIVYSPTVIMYRKENSNYIMNEGFSKSVLLQDESIKFFMEDLKELMNENL